MARQLVDHDDLIGILPRQPIGRETPDGVKLPGIGGVAQGIETRPVQPSSRAALITVFRNQRVPFRGNPLAQYLEL